MSIAAGFVNGLNRAWRGISSAKGWADALRGVSACAFPIFTGLAWVGILAIPQGDDVVRHVVERSALDDSIAELVSLAIASVLLALSLWYSMRCLLSVQRPGLPLPDPGPNGPTAWVPRLVGAAVIAWPAWIMRGLAPTGTANAAALVRQSADTWSLVFALLALGLVVVLWRRAPILRLGRAAGPTPIPADVDLPAPIARTVFWAVALMALCGVLMLTLPLSVARAVGSASLVALALACINVFGSFALTFWPLRVGLPSLTPWALLIAVLASPWNDNHAPPAASLEHAAGGKRPSIQQAYQDWLALDKTTATSDEPVYVVATEGGGIRAAYWTAAVLEHLAAEPDRHFARDLFAISSVSGGSVGAGFWVAGERARRCGPAGDTRPDTATRALRMDALSPTVGLMLFPDFMQRFVPYSFPQANRSRGLEESWERFNARLPGAPMSHSLAELYDGCPALPELLVNATVSETGQRAVLTRLATDTFVDTFSPTGIDPSTDHQPLAGVLLHSARFPLVSPAGSVLDMGKPDQPLVARLIDGGYFDNSGVVTALELIDGMRLVDSKRPIVLIVITDSTYHDCGGVDDTLYCRAPAVPQLAASRPAGPGTRWLNEPLPILAGLFDVRDSHVFEAVARALRTTQVAIVDRSRTLQPPAASQETGDAAAKRPDPVTAPLGWALSRGVTDLLDGESAEIVTHLPLRPPVWLPPAKPASAPRS